MGQSGSLGELKELEAHFHALLELAPEKRSAYLEAQVPKTLHAKLEDLVAADAEDETLARPVYAASDEPAEHPELELSPGTRINRYRITRKLGEGGFGSVYLAEQEKPIERQVALKLIKPGLSCREILARFDAERQALALMDHPSIARVLDAGATEQGWPFFVMELVHGRAITEYAEAEGLDLQARLRLFLGVCDAVQHAHRKGILHRDLKPSNVLVAEGSRQDSDPVVPKVIDFGIAKALHGRLTDQTIDSVRHRVLGTPAYMSPEQARGELDIDTRTDVYSLGSLLYELLCGTPPFDAERLARVGFSEMVRIVNEEEPPDPSTRSRGSGHLLELDWIVAKSLAKERERRYDSASELGADIRRFLAGDAISAGPVSRFYRWKKTLARHRLPFALAALLFIALTAGIAGTGAGLVEASKQRDAARLQADRAQAATDFLVETVALADPEIALDPDLSIRSLLDRAAARVEEGTRGQPEAEARVRSALGRAYESQGQHRFAEAHLRRAVEIEDASPQQIFSDRELYESLWTLTHVLFRLELPDAQEIAHRARTLAHRIVAREKPRLGALLEAMTAAIRRGAHLPEEEPVSRALEIASEVMALGENQLADEDPLWSLLADSCMDAGFSLWYTPHEARSGAFFQCAAEARRRVLPAGHPDVAEATSMWVGVLTRSGRVDEAEGLAIQALEEVRAIFPEGNFQVAFAKARLGENLTAQGRFAEAEPLLLESHEVLLQASGGPATFFPIDSHSRLIRLYGAWGREDRASHHRHALAELGASSTWPVAWPIIRWVLAPEDQDLAGAVDRLVEKIGLISYSAMAGPLTEDEVPEVGMIGLELAKLPDDDPRTIVVARLLVYATNAFQPGDPSRPRIARIALPILQPRAAQLPLDVAEARIVAALDAEPSQRKKLIDAVLGEFARADDANGDAWFTANAKARIARALAELGENQAARELLDDASSTLEVQLGPGNRDYQAVRQILNELG